MATILAAMEIQNNYNSALYSVMNTINVTVIAMEDMHQAMNSGMNQITSAADHAAESIQNNADKQSLFNEMLQAGVAPAQALGARFDKLVDKYINMDNLKKVLSLSDTMSQNTTQINAMNDGFQSTKELQDGIFQSAQRSRTSYLQMTDTVMKLGQGTKGIFDTNEETIQFSENLNKSFLIAGASQEDTRAATEQMTQALASGTVSGEALNSIFGAAPNAIQMIAEQLGVSGESLWLMASNGELSAEMLKGAMLAATDEINTATEGVPMTWGQVGQSIRDNALMAFEPILMKINSIANSQGFQTLVSNVSQAIEILSSVIRGVFDLIGQVGGFITDNWSIISPIVYGVLAAFAAYAAYLAIVSAIELAGKVVKVGLCIVSLINAAATRSEASAATKAAAATAIATASQMGLNGSLLACPITWLVLAIIALITIIFLAANAIAKFSGVASSGLGVITGALSVTMQFFRNLALCIANIALAIGGAIGALASNIMTAFYNAICSVQSWWYDLLSTALTVVAKICEALNKLPFVDFNYSGIQTAADDYAQKALEAEQQKKEYTDISDAFDKGMSTFETFQEGWVQESFQAGAAWGDGIADKISNFSMSDMFGGVEIPEEGALENTKAHEELYNQEATTTALESSGITENVGNIAENSGAMNDSLDVTEEDLSYLRDLAEAEVINRYTVAEVTIAQTNNNNVASGMDLDGVLNGLTDAMNEAVEIITEGVHT